MIDVDEVRDGAWFGWVKYGVADLIIVTQGEVDIHIDGRIVGHDNLFGDFGGARQ